MRLDPGAHELGPQLDTIRLRTYRQGLAAKAGHDLVLEAAAWSGTLVVPDGSDATPSITVEIDLRSLQVIQGTGGVKPLSESDKADIRKAMQKPLQTADHPMATFRSTDVRVEGPRATVAGALALAGQSHALELEVHRDDSAIMARGEVVQSAWGIKPYTGFLGALKLRDAVDVDISIALQD